MDATLVFYNAQIYTMDDKLPQAEAIALRGKHILAVGDSSSMRALLGPGGQAIDLEGRCVLPGLIDAHVHFGSYSIGLYQHQVDLDNVPTKAEAVARVAAAASRTPDGGWIQGGGWNKNIWPDHSFPCATDLDAAVPDHPVALEDKSHHATWVNTRALQIAGITSSTQDPPGGEIVRDDRGRPTGLLLETAAELVHAHVPDPDVSTMVEALRQGTAEAHRLGLTGVHDPGGALVLAGLQALRERGELSMRALVHIASDRLDDTLRLGIRSGMGDEYVRIGGLKIFADGALGPQTGHMLAPYEGSSTNVGIPTHSRQRLEEMVCRAHRGGLAVAVHAIGDAANRAVLDAIEKAQANSAPHPLAPALAHRIEHVQILHGDDLPRLAQLGVIASMQPIHAPSDMEMAEQYWGRRCDLAYAWRSVLDSGAVLAFGSDCPVETIDPLAGIHAAVTRRRTDGSPGPDGWIPTQRISAAEAVYAYTLGCAQAAGEAHIKGSLAPGKLADLVVVSQDILQCDPMTIADAQVDMTVFDGQIVYQGGRAL